MATQADEMKLSIRAVFADDTKETITINNINPQVGINPNMVTLIMNFNANKGGTLSTKMKSKNGANWIGIDKATTVQTRRNYIF